VEIQFYDLIGQIEEELDPVYPLDLLQLLPINEIMDQKIKISTLIYNMKIQNYLLSEKHDAKL
jgi:hypothetical protein